MHVFPGNGAFRRPPGGNPDRLEAVEGPVRRLEIFVVAVRRSVLLPHPAGHAVPRRIHAGHQAHAGRRAEGMGVRIRKRHALRGQLLHVGRAVALVQERLLRVAPVVGPERVGRILPAHVIHQENDDIGLLSGNGVGSIALGGRPGKQGKRAAGGGQETGGELHGRSIFNIIVKILST